MSDMKYGIAIELKGAIKNLKRFKKLADDFNKKLAKDQKQGQKIDKENTKVKERELKKQQTKEKRFNDWRKAQNRKLIDSQLSAHQKMEIKRVLASKKSEKDIRAEYDETLRKFRVNKRKEVEATKAANRKKLQAERANTKRLGKIRAGALGVAQAVGAAVTGGAGMIALGGNQYADSKANAAAAGMDVTEFQRQAFQVTQATNMTAEQFADITKTANERKGSAQFLEKKDDGTFGGADAGMTDFLNSVQEKLGSSLSVFQAKELANQGGKQGIEGLMQMRKQMDAMGLSMEDQAFLMESYASDAWNLTEQFKRNQKLVKQAEEDYKRLGLGIQNTEAVDRVSASFSRMWGILKAAPMEAFKSFSNALSPSTSATLQKITEKLLSFSRMLGEVFAGALNIIAPHMEKVMKLFDALAPILTHMGNALNVAFTLFVDTLGIVADVLTGTVEAIRQIVNGDFSGAFDTIKDTIKNMFASIGMALKGAMVGMMESLINFLPEWAVPDFAKDMVTSGKKDVADFKASQAVATKTPETSTPKAVATTSPSPQSVSNTPIQVNSSANVTLNLDGNVVARQVVNTEAFKNAQYSNGWY